jgi:hypothetical protein
MNWACSCVTQDCVHEFSLSLLLSFVSNCIFKLLKAEWFKWYFNKNELTLYPDKSAFNLITAVPLGVALTRRLQLFV